VVEHDLPFDIERLARPLGLAFILGAKGAPDQRLADGTLNVVGHASLIVVSAALTTEEVVPCLTLAPSSMYTT